MNLKHNENLRNLELPTEKCKRHGASTLTDVELLAVILRCGTSCKNVLDLSKSILDTFAVDGKLSFLANISFEELIKLSGIGEVKACQLLCLFELSKRINTQPVSNNTYFNSPDIVAGVYMAAMRLLETEHVYLLLLDSQNSLIKEIHLSTGSIKASVLEPREVFIHALRHNAVGIILIHNHPSGNPTPSKADKLTTIKINEASHLMGISLIDHIIIGDNKYISLKETGII